MLNLRKGKTSVKSVVGSVRQSQMITTFGVGAMVDFVNQTTMISGTDNWDWANDDNYRIYNVNLQHLLGVQYFVKPKISMQQNAGDKPIPDIPSVVFPHWLYCPACHSLVEASRNKLGNKKFSCWCGKDKQLVPSRFVLVCPNGHIEDFPYSWWVHEGQGVECDPNKKHNLRMYYVGNKTDMDSLFIECSCGAKRSMKNAGAANAFSHYGCHGNRPWLGDREECHAAESNEFPRLRIRNESSVYFPANVSALTIPPWSIKIAGELQKYLGMSLADSNKEFVVNLVAPKFPNVQKKDILDLLNKLIVKKTAKAGITMADIMEDEYESLLMPCQNEQSIDYMSHAEEVPEEYDHIIDKVISCDRLTVITAMTGFTRLTAPIGYDDARLCPISKTPKDWYPGIEQRGEGIFIEFNQKLLNKWSQSVATRYSGMRHNLERAGIVYPQFSVQYVFLHTFAHLFIRELSNVCGYSAASLKERIYSTYDNSEKKMSGILIYTSTADADGSLGGLTEQAKKEKFGRILHSMIERGMWCSSDPVCYTSTEQGYMSLNYAACFACTLLPETSCEFRNAFLDRCAVCGKPDNEKLGLMNWKKKN